MKQIHNDKCSVFFENDVIANHVFDGDYTGIFSSRFKEKVGWSADQIVSRMQSVHLVDGYSFFKNHNGMKHEFLKRFNDWHPGSHDLFNMVLERIGMKPVSLKYVVRTPVFQNAFVLRSDLYKKYVSDCLRPAIEALSQQDIKPLAYRDSKYKKTIPERLKNELGIAYYTMHPFILERLFSVWATEENVTIINFHKSDRK